MGLVTRDSGNSFEPKEKMMNSQKFQALISELEPISHKFCSLRVVVTEK